MSGSNEKAADGAAASTVGVDSYIHNTQSGPFSEDPYLPGPLEEFKDHRMWVCFDVSKQKDGKFKKIPINPHTGNLAKSNDSSTWGTFQEAKSMMRHLEIDPGARYKPRHLGFALTLEIGLVFLDLDHVIDSETGAILPQAAEIVEKVDSYVEYSQSKTGLHIYARGKKLTSLCKKGFLEIYDHGRFSCITNMPCGKVRPLREATAGIAEVSKQYLGESPKFESTQDSQSILKDDDEIITKASAAKNGPKFKRLYYEGDLGEHGGDESAADQALMNIFAFYTKDIEQLERLFSHSALAKRDKWQTRPDYRERTINAAIKFVGAGISPTGKSQKIPEIIIASGNLHLTTDMAENVLVSKNPGIYQRSGQLVRVVAAATTPSRKGISRSENAHVITQVSIPFLTETLTRQAKWIVIKDKKKKQVDCPEKIASTLLARGSWQLPVLRGFIYAPTLRPNGTIVAQPGFDLETGLLLLDCGVVWIPLEDSPIREDALRALVELRELIKGFPFTNPESESVAISGILTGLIRKSIATAPMHGFSAPKMGSGKSLLADSIGLIVTGKPNCVLSVAENEIEERKRLLSVLMEGDLMICYDNIERPFGSPSLCSVLTQREFKDRVLGVSATATVPTDSCFLATGNNLTIIGDLSTRVLLCQMDAGIEHPEERSFSINLYDYIPEHRARLVYAGLIILKAFDVAGRPSQNLKPFGRFEDWSNWVRSAIVWLGMPDPCLTRKEIEATDPVRTALNALFTSWFALFDSFPIKIKALVSKASEDGESNALLKEALIELASTPKGEINERSLANRLKHFKNRIEQGYRLETAGELQGTTLWRIKKVE